MVSIWVSSIGLFAISSKFDRASSTSRNSQNLEPQLSILEKFRVRRRLNHFENNGKIEPFCHWRVKEEKSRFIANNIGKRKWMARRRNKDKFNSGFSLVQYGWEWIIRLLLEWGYSQLEWLEKNDSEQQNSSLLWNREVSGWVLKYKYGKDIR
jgi:hypothetical protein